MDNSTLGPCDLGKFVECWIAGVIWQTLSPIMITVGTVGNVLVILVMSSRRMKVSRICDYLRFLAVADTIVLYTGLMRFFVLYWFHLDIRATNDITCKLHMFATNLSVALSIYIMCAMTVDRALQLGSPIQFGQRCPRASTCIVVASIVAFLVILNCHLLFGMQKNEISMFVNSTLVYDGQCRPFSASYARFWYRVWPKIVIGLYGVLPTLSIIVANGYICKVVSNIGSHDSKSITRMLVAVCVYYCFTAMSTTIYLCLRYVFFDMTNAHHVAKERLYWSIVGVIMYSNNTVNFLVYCVSGTTFRHELRRRVLGIHNAIIKRLFGRPPSVLRNSTVGDTELELDPVIIIRPFDNVVVVS